jgi:hypothetical protein
MTPMKDLYGLRRPQLTVQRRLQNQYFPQARRMSRLHRQSMRRPMRQGHIRRHHLHLLMAELHRAIRLRHNQDTLLLAMARR